MVTKTKTKTKRRWAKLDIFVKKFDIWEVHKVRVPR